MATILNRGVRHWDLKPGKDKAGNPVKRRLSPGGSIETLDQEEADQLLAHHRELVDAEKALPQVADKIKALTEQLAADQAELVEAKEKLAKYESDDDDKEAKGKGKGKDK